MTATYDCIATTTLGSTQSSVTFSSISGSYTDLVLIASGIMSSGGTAGIVVYLNNDTGTNYSAIQLDADGSTATSYKDNSSNGMNIGILSGANRANSIIQFINYSNTTTHKTVLARGNNPGGYVRAAIGMWRSTSAVNRIDLSNPSTNFASGTTFSLYGIKAE